MGRAEALLPLPWDLRVRICTSPKCRAAFLFCLMAATSVALAAPLGDRQDWDARGAAGVVGALLGGGVGGWLSSRRGPKSGAEQGAREGAEKAMERRFGVFDDRFSHQDNEIAEVRSELGELRRGQSRNAAAISAQVRDALQDVVDSVRERLREHDSAVAARVEAHEEAEMEGFAEIRRDIAAIRTEQQVTNARLASVERRRTEQERQAHEEATIRAKAEGGS